jgi:uncharacterized membrane protein
MIYIILLFSLILFALTNAVKSNKEVKLAIINGFMIGALYDVEEVDNEKWHTLQILVGILSINILWDEKVH